MNVLPADRRAGRARSGPPRRQRLRRRPAVVAGRGRGAQRRAVVFGSSARAHRRLRARRRRRRAGRRSTSRSSSSRTWARRSWSTSGLGDRQLIAKMRGGRTADRRRPRPPRLQPEPTPSLRSRRRPAAAACRKGGASWRKVCERSTPCRGGCSTTAPTTSTSGPTSSSSPSSRSSPSSPSSRSVWGVVISLQDYTAFNARPRLRRPRQLPRRPRRPDHLALAQGLGHLHPRHRSHSSDLALRAWR